MTTVTPQTSVLDTQSDVYDGQVYTDRVVKTSGGNELISTSGDGTLVFVTAKAEYFLDLLPMIAGEPQVLEQIVNGRVRRYDLLEVLSLTANGVDLKELGVDAIGYSADTMSIVLLKAAKNDIGGQPLSTRPSSWCRFRRPGMSQSFRLLEVKVV